MPFLLSLSWYSLEAEVLVKNLSRVLNKNTVFKLFCILLFMKIYPFLRIKLKHLCSYWKDNYALSFDQEETSLSLETMEVE